MKRGALKQVIPAPPTLFSLQQVGSNNLQCAEVRRVHDVSFGALLAPVEHRHTSD